jgi:hypothetical protein
MDGSPQMGFSTTAILANSMPFGRRPPHQNWLSNSVFETYDDIIDAACQAWNKLIAKPDIIRSIGMRDWAHVGHN